MPPAPNLELTTWHNALHSIKFKERREVLKKLKHAAWEIPFPVYFSISTSNPNSNPNTKVEDEENDQKKGSENVNGNVLGKEIGQAKKRASVGSIESETSIEDEEGHELYQPIPVSTQIPEIIPNPKPAYEPGQGNVTAGGSANGQAPDRRNGQAKKRDSVMSIESITSIEDDEGHNLFLPPNPNPAPIPAQLPTPTLIPQNVSQQNLLVTPAPTPSPKQKPKPKRILKIHLDTDTERGREWCSKVRGEASNPPPASSPSPSSSSSSSSSSAEHRSLTAGNGKKEESKARRELLLLLYKLKEEVEYQAWRSGAGKSWGRLKGLKKPLTLRFRVGKRRGSSPELDKEEEGRIQEEDIESERLGHDKSEVRNGKRKRMISDDEEEEEFKIQNVIDRGVGKRRIFKKVKWEPEL